MVRMSPAGSDSSFIPLLIIQEASLDSWTQIIEVATTASILIVKAICIEYTSTAQSNLCIHFGVFFPFLYECASYIQNLYNTF